MQGAYNGLNGVHGLSGEADRTELRAALGIRLPEALAVPVRPYARRTECEDRSSTALVPNEACRRRGEASRRGGRVGPATTGDR